MENIIDILNQFAKISEEVRADLSNFLSEIDLPKGKLLLKNGKICQSIYFIKTGAVRGYYSMDGKEVTSWFAFEKDIFTSLYSLLNQKPSLYSIEILEDSSLDRLNYDDLQYLYKKYPEFNLIGRLITEKYYCELDERTFSLQFLSAQDRYRQLIEQQPQLLQRASLGHIASYLGISQETLSRIRARF